MDALQTLAPLFGVVIGSGLTGFGASLRARAERKRIVALALADLLEVRHHVVSIDVVLREMRARFEVPSEAIPILRNFFDDFVPINAPLHERYDNAISLLAGINPVLAFSMRSKNTLPQILASLRGMAIGSGTDPGEFEHLEVSLLLAVTPSLNEAVMELARQHSYSTARKVRQLVARSEKFPPELVELFKQLESLPTKTAHSSDEQPTG